MKTITVSHDDIMHARDAAKTYGNVHFYNAIPRVFPGPYTDGGVVTMNYGKRRARFAARILEDAERWRRTIVRNRELDAMDAELASMTAELASMDADTYCANCGSIGRIQTARGIEPCWACVDGVRTKHTESIPQYVRKSLDNLRSLL